MGSRITPELSRLINERKIMKAQINSDMVLKEIEGTQTDLQDAQKDSLQNNKFK